MPMVATKIKCSQFSKKISDQTFFLDDESHFTLTYSNFNYNGGYYIFENFTT